MGYHVSILRTQSGVSEPIGQDEIRQAISRMNGQIAIAPNKAELELYLPEKGDDGEALWYTDGELWTSNPSDRMIALMIELASHLGARVRGDEGESYRTVNDTYVHPDDILSAEPDSSSESPSESSAGSRPTVRSFIRGARNLLLTVVALVLLVHFAKKLFVQFTA